MPKKENIELAAQALAVLTALSFLASAILQEVIFAWWGLDFAAIAFVEDVVLGGIRFLATYIAMGLVLFPGIVFQHCVGDGPLRAGDLPSFLVRWIVIVGILASQLPSF
jgi:hypothetical protein